MIGTTTKRARQDGKPAWGYSFFAGRTPAGKRIQITKGGFDTRKEATDALREAIEHYRPDGNGGDHLTFSAFLERWLDKYAKHRSTAKAFSASFRGAYRSFAAPSKSAGGETNRAEPEKSWDRFLQSGRGLLQA